MNTTQNLIFYCMYASLVLAASISFSQLPPAQMQKYEQIMANMAKQRQEAVAKRSAGQTGGMVDAPYEPPINLPYQDALQEQELKRLVESGID